MTDTGGLSSQATKTVTVSSTDSPPAAVLAVSPASGPAPLAVSADASASTDSDATPIASYSFNFGDGTTVGPQAGATASHTYSSAGSYTVTVTVTDTGGLSSQATKTVTVSSTSINLVGNSGFEAGLSGWNASGSGTGVTLTQVAAGHGGIYAAALTNTSTANSGCTLNDSPNWITTTSTGTYTGSLWVRADSPGRSLNLRFREYTGTTLDGSATTTITLTTSWQLVAVTYKPTQPGASTLDFNAYTTTANSPPGVCFYADDASIVLG